MNLNSGFPPANKTAPAHRRYVGKFYYCAYWRMWDEVLDVDGGMWWTVRQVGSSEVRKHCTPMRADRFADAPFEV